MEEVPMEQEGGVQGAQETPEVDPKLQKDSDAYVSGLMKMLHSKETAPKVLEMLKAGDPMETVPQTALLVNKQMEDGLKGKGSKPSLETLLVAGVYLTNDLVEIGNTAGLFQIEGEEAIAPLIQSTLQTYIEAGLKDKSIDPIELQEAVAPLMNEDQVGQGLSAAGANGVPEAPDQNTAMEQYATKREQKATMLKGGQ